MRENNKKAVSDTNTQIYRQFSKTNEKSKNIYNNKGEMIKMVLNMDVDRVTFTQTIRKLAKLDFSNLVKKTSLIDETESEYTKNKINQIDDVFRVHSLDKFISIEVKRGKSTFLRNFITENEDNNFDFTVNYKKGDLKITIEKRTINERNFEELVKLMYLHSLG